MGTRSLCRECPGGGGFYPGSWGLLHPRHPSCSQGSRSQSWLQGDGRGLLADEEPSEAAF